MSREERRAYERQMKGMERGPALPPGARARAERNAARRAARGSSSSAAGSSAGRRFWIRAGLIAIILGFLAFSFQWGEGMPRALYAGLAVAAGAFLVAVAVRFLQARVARTP